jgi:hypothetical protein
MYKYTSELRADELGIKSSNLDNFEVLHKNLKIWNSFSDVRYESEHKKGQFEPAEVGKIAEKHFIWVASWIFTRLNTICILYENGFKISYFYEGLWNYPLSRQKKDSILYPMILSFPIFFRKWTNQTKLK